MAEAGLTRRRLLKTAAFGTGALALPFVHGAHAAGRLSAFFWDHPVPSVPPAMRKLCESWAAREKVDLQLDFVSTNGDKILLTLAAEGQAGAGHDIATIPSWYVSGQVERLEPVDDLVAALVEQNGKLDWTAEYLGKFDGHWAALPVSTGSPTLPACARIDLMKRHAGIDITAMYPADGQPDKALADTWNWDNFLTAARKCFEAGYPFGLPLGVTPDSVDWVGATFASYGAELVDSQRQYHRQLRAGQDRARMVQAAGPVLPQEVFAWDNASNNKYLISGKGSLILNPPSAWAVALRDAPQIAEQLWTFPPPKGPKGRIEAGIPWYWGIWKFSSNKAGGKEPLDVPVAALLGRGAGHREPRLRRAALRELPRFQGVGRGGPAKGHLAQLPAARRHGAVDRLRPGPAKDRQPDVCAGHNDKAGGALHAAGAIDRQGDRLGRAGDRRLHAELTARSIAALRSQ